MSTSFPEAIGILSIGEMGLGIAQLLIAHKYRVLTYASDRSDATQRRAWESGIELRPSLQDLVDQSDCLLSIVPPRDALETARRIVDASSARPLVRDTPLYVVDLNAVSPKTAREIASLISAAGPHLQFIDGGIVGGPPRPSPTENNSPDKPTWKCPSLVVSGPVKLPDEELSNTLNMKHISDEIGVATGLKMCFASLTKGYTSLAIQSFTTAHALGVLPDLKGLMEEYNPAGLQMAEKGLVGMPPKAYRWVREMREIGDTMRDDGGFESDLFYAVAQVYQSVANDPVLGREKPGDRQRGQTVEDVVGSLHRSLKVKME
ncbi:6-phosphogluconate dehydrogenase C-terminal domain-like protein [Aspergillus sclerotioniger CBS 115572]|uniref:6-phosphogluconate dehydrogenase C-terminal domain-like protein n=1 Tax=Aspergillus sclerotioniger CBS 115572 TaxID=1450535 RepID=A0A317V2P8_9EURO|nr:6-phosphogluconate dehydrogenase C-terminal domain-like protein [Aspergillus sclerotioniger CBS 115572]PWY67107.1 6-phosphogluconate dehydrogenase C-terminal domain-like protein [Aspergillus sclerotioniger CBS 115572]